MKDEGVAPRGATASPRAAGHPLSLDALLESKASVDGSLDVKLSVITWAFVIAACLVPLLARRVDLLWKIRLPGRFAPHG